MSGRISSINQAHRTSAVGLGDTKLAAQSNNTQAQKNIEHWEVLQLDPRGGTPCFANSLVSPEYASYNPPQGYTAEEIMQFKGAKEVFESVEDVQKLIALRDELGSLDQNIEDPLS